MEWGQHFKEIKLTIFVANDKIRVLKQKLKLWKIFICFLILKTLLMWLILMVVLTIMAFLLCYNEICQHQEEMHNSLNQCFPNKTCFKKSCIDKSHSKCKKIIINKNFIDMIWFSLLQQTFKNYLLLSFSMESSRISAVISTGY